MFTTAAPFNYRHATSPVAAAILLYDANPAHTYSYTLYNFATDGAESRTITGTQLPKAIAMNITNVGVVFVGVGTNEVLEEWKYDQIGMPAKLAQWNGSYGSAVTAIRATYPLAKIVYVEVRKFDVGCTQLTAPYYGYGVNPYVGAGLSVEPYVDETNAAFDQMTLGQGNASIVAMGDPVADAPLYVPTDYGLPADTTTSCLHINPQGGSDWAANGLVQALP